MDSSILLWTGSENYAFLESMNQTPLITYRRISKRAFLVARHSREDGVFAGTTLNFIPTIREIKRLYPSAVPFQTHRIANHFYPQK